MQDKVYLVKDVCLLTSNVAQIFLIPQEEPLVYEAGQYIKVVFPDQSTSPLSIANIPDPSSNILEFHLLFSQENYKAMSIMQQVKVAGQLALRGPYGNCTASQLLSQKPIIFLARSTGFAPIKAVIESLLQQKEYPPMHLYWSVPGWRNIYMQELVETWVKSLNDFRFTAVLSREMPTHLSVKFGKIPEVVLQDYPSLSAYQAYASGPEAMVYAALEGFKLHGLSHENFYSDVFNYVP